MITNLIQIGNSQGIRLPKKIIEQFNLNKISLEILKDGILLKPIKENSIDSWDTPELRNAASKENFTIKDDFTAIDIDDKDWEW
ncbi:Growth regulator [Campylobacter hyointestinalis subsp. hyointestinalis]|uniref:Growth regulator n=1 Tax=Campylobacter hyointestinalis subsp. hyointestinalis TaxID=91352 RepID=A0A9W5ATR6_CAMHY|nr:AbrB/MazE/SpoVT family DNA-binding domain-containing protein [Campylobacter hyointestinalis]CUU70613.1 Growth regulator [Campylobacter hyointestinalis subsp. hyointestinalis]CUU70615.1 Growth regulator [Campylobacter hyointestinalis subsp. hyointestinalis]CUU85669.1 Growth regulator [Campylobacter hyointestinalis subsp. hyointestinalis]